MNSLSKSPLVRIVAVAYIVCSIPALIGGAAIMAFPIPAVAAGGAHDAGLIFAMFGLGVALVATLGLGLLLLVAGSGLLGRRQWARILSLVLSVLMMPLVPIGTAIGLFALIVLLQEDVRREFLRAA
jgi:hypothetical protein